MLLVHHLAVRVVDLERSERFYCDVLGLPLIRRHVDRTGRPRSIWLELGGDAFLALERAEVPQPTRADTAPGWHCVSFAMEAEARVLWRERLLEAGIRVERESDYSIYFRDPDNNLIALSHYPDEAPEGSLTLDVPLSVSSSIKNR
jgi:glyoxylase I family protein